MAAKKSDAKPRAKPRSKPVSKPKPAAKASKQSYVTFISPHQSLRVNGPNGTIQFVDGKYTTEDVNEVHALAGISFDQPALLTKGT